ncbi:uncharacterized protein LOC120685834 isoform X3 [Panicum virgatum]|uniref:non-specific serine/threonine protein kinase n=1 Tax=Panicum virgatum TaxID=38727 RepID=A0A8T0P8J1_PANVG|nr:uncharacterized protein LOC120685834 isoform X3 [Panicum virgatum]KAG2557145.1 hypothetical protein PVAP13_8NG164900 [Panicum virgatum]
MALLAFQQENLASLIASRIIAELHRQYAFDWAHSGFPEIEGSAYVYENLAFSALTIVYGVGCVPAKPQWKSSEVVKASESRIMEGVSEIFVVREERVPSQVHEKSVELTGGITLADKTHRLLCCTQKENLDEHHGIDWHTRYKIIQGICEGLAYLHRQLEYCICHGDVKPDNILLDAIMVPKIADFGLSRYYGEEIVGTSKIVKCNGTILLSDKMVRLLCFEYLQKGNLAAYLSDEHHVIDWHTRYKIIKGISEGLSYLHTQLEHLICHFDVQPDNILLDANMVPKIADFDLSRCFAEELARNKTNCIGTQRYEAPEMNGKKISYLSDIYRLGLLVLSILKITWWRQAMWIMLESSAKQMKRLNQIALSCLETGKSTKVTRSTASSTQRAADDINVPDSGVRIGATVDVPKMKPSPDCINMVKAPSTPEDSVVLVLDSGSSKLAQTPSMHRHLSHSNLTDERSNKPLSNRAPATNSSDDTTRAPVEPNKLTDDAAHSEPNSSVDERDTNEEARRSGKWYVATGAAHHATGDRGLITNLVELENDSLCVHAADGTPMLVRGRGNVETDNVVLPDVYYVPGLWTNLVSVGQLAGLDYCIGFSRGACHISDAAGTVVGTAHARGDGLYEVDHLRVPLAGAYREVL